MPSDTTPPSGYRLESPARTAGGAGTGHGTAPRRPAPADPSWRKVIATTLHLWLRRRVLRVPDSRQIGKVRAASLLAVVLVAVAAGAITAVTALSRSHAAAAHQPRAAPRQPALTPAQARARALAGARAAANGRAAATWIAAQVSHQEVIGCDPAVCAAILAAGYDSGRDVVLQPGVLLPSSGSVVVATPAVRAQYGLELASAAPAVIAAFGTGPQAVQVRLVTAGGQATYAESASSAVTARRAAGRKLLAISRVRAHASARADLTAGLVDPRLLTVLQRLAARYPLDIDRFADAGPLADSSMPFRLAEIVGLTSRRAGHRASELASVEKLLLQQPAGYRAALTVARQLSGRYSLKIQFPAPSPF